MKINKSFQTSKKGVNLIHSIVDNNDCFIHEVQQENDLGIDAIIEFSNNEMISGKHIAVQIKTGPSYLNRKNNKCYIPIKSHKDYWMSHDLPVYGFICDLVKNCFYYVDIKQYIKDYKEEIEAGQKKTIAFPVAFYNTITSENFNNLFQKRFFSITPYLPFYDAKKLLLSTNVRDISLAIRILRDYHFDLSETWEIMLGLLRNDSYSSFHRSILIYLSIGTHNPDILRTGKGYEASVTNSRKILKIMNQEDMVRLLGLVDEEDGFCRGSIGECVDFAIQFIPNHVRFIIAIVNDRKLPLSIRNSALFLLACYDTTAFINAPTKDDFSDFTMLYSYITKYGALNPYS